MFSKTLPVLFLLAPFQAQAVHSQMDWRYPIGISLVGLYVARHATQLPGVSQWSLMSDLLETTENLQWQVGKQAAYTLAGQWGASMLALRAQQYFPAIWQKHSDADLNPWKHATVCYLGYVVIQFAFDCALEGLLGWGRSVVSAEAEDALRAKYAKQESLLKLSSLNQSDTRVHNVFGQFKESVDSALALQSSGLSALVKMAYYAKVLYDTQAMGMAVWMLSVEQIASNLPVWIAGQIVQKAEQLRGVHAQIERLQSDLMSQAQAIIASNRTEQLDETLKNLVFERRRLEDSARLWGGVLPVVKRHIGSIEYVSKYAFMALWAGPVAKENSASVISGGFEFSRAVAWPADNADNLERIKSNLHNVRNVIELIKRPVSTPYFNLSSTKNPGIELCGASVGIDEQILIKDIELKLGPGRHVLTGNNGKGKSTLLRQIAGQRDHHTWSQGELRSSGTLVFVPQHEYWMPYQTLTGSLGADVRAEACEKVGICRDDWDVVRRDWGNALSGGERKKLALLAAVSKKPDILILDEIFDGMDPEAIEQSKRLIRSLVNSTVIIVDHEYEAHHKDGFYTTLTSITPEKSLETIEFQK